MDLRVGPRFPGLTINGTQAFLGIAYSSARKISACTYIGSKQVLCSLAQLRTAGSSTNAYSPDSQMQEQAIAYFLALEISTQT